MTQFFVKSKSMKFFPLESSAIKEFGSLYVEEVKDDNIITLLNEALEG